MRMDVEHAGMGKGAIVASAAVGRQLQVVGVLRPDDAGVVDAQEYAGTRERRALRDQRGRERLGLGAGLAKDDAVAGTDKLRKVERHPAMLTFAFNFPAERKML